MRVLGAFVLAIVLFVAGCLLSIPSLLRHYSYLQASYYETQHGYQFRVYVEPRIPFGPGDGTGNPGYVQVLTLSGYVMNERKLDEASSVHDVRFGEDAVHFRYMRRGIEYDSALALPQ